MHGGERWSPLSAPPPYSPMTLQDCTDSTRPPHTLFPHSHSTALNDAKASLPKPQLANDEAILLAGCLRVARPILVVYYCCEAVSWAKLYCGALGFLRLEEEYWFSLVFVHAAFWPKSESEKRCLGEQIFAKRETFFDHALRLVNDFLTLKSSFWLNCTYR